MDYLIRKAKTVRKMKALFTGASKRTMRRSLTESRKEESFEGMGKPSVSHATVVIFLEFFAWGLMTTPTINALKDAFPTGTFLKNGFVQGIKGLLSFLSAPLIGALSDVWGRKSFLLLCVFFTCLPIPLLLFDSKFYFISMSLSGIFCVTFSIVFAYVADCTTEKERSYSYGLVSATFAASLVLSPALGTWICGFPNGQTQVVIISSLVTLFNLLFIMYIVPESLPESSRKTLWGSPISWRQADPFSSLRKAGNDTRLLLLSIMVFLSYLPEAGQYSCFFLYLRQV
jgi:MFS family permease